MIQEKLKQKQGKNNLKKWEHTIPLEHFKFIYS